MKPPGAEVAAILDVVVLGQWRDHGGPTLDLADAAQDDLGAAVVELQSSADLNGLSSQPPDVTYIS